MAYAKYSGELEWEGQKVEFTCEVYGKPYHFPEKRVDGNPTMIESFEESGVTVTDVTLCGELIIDGFTMPDDYENDKLNDEIFGFIEEENDRCNIEWEFDDEF